MVWRRFGKLAPFSIHQKQFNRRGHRNCATGFQAVCISYIIFQQDIAELSSFYKRRAWRFLNGRRGLQIYLHQSMCGMTSVELFSDYVSRQRRQINLQHDYSRPGTTYHRNVNVDKIQRLRETSSNRSLLKCCDVLM